MDEFQKKIFKNRIIFSTILICAVFIALGLRLYYIQVYKEYYYSNAALKQRSKKVSLEPKRGIIFDRNNIKLTNNKTTPTLILQRDLLKEDQTLYKEIEKNTLLSKKELKEKISSDEKTLKIPLKKEFNLSNKYENLFLVDMVNRYNSKNHLSHVIGYINKAQNTGESGIEKTFDEFLKIEDTDSLIVEYSKNRSMIIGGRKYVTDNIDPRDPAGVKLTIDYELQKKIEEILDRERIKGSVIVSDINGEILSMASRPNFDQEKIQNFFNSKDMALYNKAIQVSYPPGSIFKIIVLLTLLEDENIEIKESYHCKGFEEVNGIRINCTAEHGNISLEEGFSKSCNSLFVQLGKELGAKKIIEMAKKFGLGERINIGLSEEVEGNLPDKYNMYGAAIGNISIGQGQIEVTPLQISSILTTIVNEGVKKPITLVKAITNKEGKVVKEYRKSKDKRIISKESANKTLDMLRLVVKKGTGRKMDLSTIGSAGGKTGSAQALIESRPVINGWFTGFYPSQNPKYIITVLVEDSISGSQSAAPVFEKIVKFIYSTSTKHKP